MTIYEYGDEKEKKVLFIATAALEPYWAFQRQVEALDFLEKWSQARQGKRRSFSHDKPIYE